jgi:hypothetical protein
MKKLYLNFSFFIITSICYGQDRITVAISNGSTFIETEWTANFTYDDGSGSYKSDEYTKQAAYRLGPSATTKLNEGLNTALKWIDLNRIHNKEFEKEVCRFMVMEKGNYRTYGYVPGMGSESQLLFTGHSDGSFNLILETNDLHTSLNYSPFLYFKTKENVVKFKDILNGKSANKEIDDIFKN